MSIDELMHYQAKEDITVPAVVWGRDKEETAREAYSSLMKTKHTNFRLQKVGLVVKEDQLFLAASPDALFSCSCCGDGVVEIKCPYKYKDGLQGSREDKRFCLDENLHLRKSHQYYSQVNLVYNHLPMFLIKDMYVS